MTSNFNIIFVSFIGLISSHVTKNAAESYDYCDPKLKLCDEPGDHVMCKYPVSGPSKKCPPEIYEPLQGVEKQRILLLHNKFRSVIATSHEDLPTASNMRELYWDRELELLAERWAQQCVSITASKVYDECRNIKRFRVSQNVGTRRVHGATIDKQAPQTVVAWFKESKDFLPSYVDDFPQVAENETAVRQFTNMIWANAYAIGCARAIFQERHISRTINGTKKNVWTVERLICNYGPSENMVGKPVYKKGAPCENCPKGTICSQGVPGLCAIPIIEMFHRMMNAENETQKESCKEATSHISDDEGEDAINNNPSNHISVNEIQQNAKMSKSGRLLIKKGIYVNGRCSLIRNPGVTELSDENPDRSFFDVDGRKVTEQCAVIVLQKKRGQSEMVPVEMQKLTMENEETKKTVRDVDTEKSPQHGEPCLCYVTKRRRYSEHGTAPRKGVGHFLFCAITFSRLLLL